MIYWQWKIDDMSPLVMAVAVFLLGVSALEYSIKTEQAFLTIQRMEKQIAAIEYAQARRKPSHGAPFFARKGA